MFLLLVPPYRALHGSSWLPAYSPRYSPIFQNSAINAWWDLSQRIWTVALSPSQADMGTMALGWLLAARGARYRTSFLSVSRLAAACSPRIRTLSFPSSTCRIYAPRFEKLWDFDLSGSLVRLVTPLIRFLCIRPRICLQLPTETPPRVTPLPLATVPAAESVEDLHRRVNAHARRTKKTT
jgi:hypothetical protein